MKKILSFFVLIASFSCTNFVNDVDGPIGVNTDSAFNKESEFEALSNGVKLRFAEAYGLAAFLSDLLSDHLVANPTQTIIEQNLLQIDAGQIRIDNPSATRLFRKISELRFLSDDMLRRVEGVTFRNGDFKKEILYTGRLYRGLAAYLYATYIGIREKEGGSVMDGGVFLSSSQLYDEAIQHFELAMEATQNVGQKKIVFSVMAKTHFFNQKLNDALSAAQNGLQNGDLSLQASFTSASPNPYWKFAGRGNSTFIVNPLLVSKESIAAGLKVEQIASDTTLWVQRKYLDETSAIDFISPQENILILSEVRGLLNSVDRELLLFVQGTRLPDQRRANKFHLPAGTWQYFPIPEEERLRNPNID